MSSVSPKLGLIIIKVIIQIFTFNICFYLKDDIEEKSVCIESSLIDMEIAYEEHYSKLEKENHEKKK